METSRYEEIPCSNICQWKKNMRQLCNEVNKERVITIKLEFACNYSWTLLYSFVTGNNCHTWFTHFLDPKIFWGPKFSDPKFFLTQILSDPKLFWIQKLQDPNFLLMANSAISSRIKTVNKLSWECHTRGYKLK